MTEDEYKPEQISEYVQVQMLELKQTPTPSMVHLPTGEILKTWAAIEGMEMGAWCAIIDYATAAVQLEAVAWERDDVDFLFPCANFTERYMDPVGFGDKTVAEVSAELMEKLMRENF